MTRSGDIFRPEQITGGKVANLTRSGLNTKRSRQDRCKLSLGRTVWFALPPCRQGKEDKARGIINVRYMERRGGRGKGLEFEVNVSVLKI